MTLGFTPTHTFSDYLKSSEIKVYKNISDGKDAVNKILESFQILLKKERTILNLASKADDEGTSALMSDYIREQEKLAWMYSAYNH